MYIVLVGTHLNAEEVEHAERVAKTMAGTGHILIVGSRSMGKSSTAWGSSVFSQMQSASTSTASWDANQEVIRHARETLLTIAATNRANAFKEEEIPEPEPAGCMEHLYRNPFHNSVPRVVRRHVIHQPCWKRGRWKSLT